MKEEKSFFINLSDIVSMGFVRVPAGEFLKGKNADQKVFVDEFWVGKTPVTNQQFQVYKPSHNIPEGKENHPVVYIDWYEARNFCLWLKDKTGLDVRLPTNAEWEKAARGNNGSKYPWGNTEATPEKANFNYEDDLDSNLDIGEPAEALTTPVDAHPKGASPYGALDIAGNVYEWVSDWDWGYEFSHLYNVQEIENGNIRMLRSGSWFTFECETYYLNAVKPDVSFNDYGFRCALKLQ